MIKRMRVKGFLAASLAALTAGVLGLSCGGSDNSANTSPTGGCTIGGHACQFTCTADLGCVECATNSDCGAAQPYCILGRCEVCSANADCGTGQACYPGDHTCHPTCTATSCNAPAPICDAASGACVGCVDKTNCTNANRPLCSPQTHQCVGCTVNADCGAAAPVCLLREGTCVECVLDSDCAAGFACDNDHHCHSSCSTNADCKDASHPFCNAATGDCVECVKPSDCGATAPICNNDGNCVQCAVNADCTQATAPICHGDHCVQCESPQDCITQPNCTSGGCKCKAQQCGP